MESRERMSTVLVALTAAFCFSCMVAATMLFLRSRTLLRAAVKLRYGETISHPEYRAMAREIANMSLDERKSLVAKLRARWMREHPGADPVADRARWDEPTQLGPFYACYLRAEQLRGQHVLRESQRPRSPGDDCS